MLQVCNRKSYKTDMWNYRRLYERPPNKVLVRPEQKLGLFNQRLPLNPDWVG